MFLFSAATVIHGTLEKWYKIAEVTVPMVTKALTVQADAGRINGSKSEIWYRRCMRSLMVDFPLQNVQTDYLVPNFC